MLCVSALRAARCKDEAYRQGAWSAVKSNRREGWPVHNTLACARMTWSAAKGLT